MFWWWLPPMTEMVVVDQQLAVLQLNVTSIRILTNVKYEAQSVDPMCPGRLPFLHVTESLVC